MNLCERCEGLTHRPHKNSDACMRALWSEAREIERQMVFRDPLREGEQLLRAIRTHGASGETPKSAPAPSPAPKRKPERNMNPTRGLRDPSPQIVRRPRADSSEAAQAF